VKPAFRKLDHLQESHRGSQFNHPGHLDGGHRLVASSHPPGAAAVPPDREFVLFVLFFHFCRIHGLRKGQREGAAVVDG
jgi:hypothetical protein